ncbi:hypothetical protein K458DRAFT_38273 [Lentithecium fluviatile CBS 122367]|uniref:Uncharacterized protein n=1 Tax=Lentithecium fluviatile CBS 122367 TaxID=1168545 RepID=A0A6G1J0Y1_9PLEO|nr:hypothetical protein K458DRAFT_38273 [Lentithecium fluviatile CBS 122367]
MKGVNNSEIEYVTTPAAAAGGTGGGRRNTHASRWKYVRSGEWLRPIFCCARCCQRSSGGSAGEVHDGTVEGDADGTDRVSLMTDLPHSRDGASETPGTEGGGHSGREGSGIPSPDRTHGPEGRETPSIVRRSTRRRRNTESRGSLTASSTSQGPPTSADSPPPNSPPPDGPPPLPPRAPFGKDTSDWCPEEISNACRLIVTPRGPVIVSARAPGVLAERVLAAKREQWERGWREDRIDYMDDYAQLMHRIPGEIPVVEDIMALADATGRPDSVGGGRSPERNHQVTSAATAAAGIQDSSDPGRTLEEIAEGVQALQGSGGYDENARGPIFPERAQAEVPATLPSTTYQPRGKAPVHVEEPATRPYMTESELATFRAMRASLRSPETATVEDWSDAPQFPPLFLRFLQSSLHVNEIEEQYKSDDDEPVSPTSDAPAPTPDTTGKKKRPLSTLQEQEEPDDECVSPTSHTHAPDQGTANRTPRRLPTLLELGELANIPARPTGTIPAPAPEAAGSSTQATLLVAGYPIVYSHWQNGVGNPEVNSAGTTSTAVSETSEAAPTASPAERHDSSAQVQDSESRADPAHGSSERGRVRRRACTITKRYLEETGPID